MDGFSRSKFEGVTAEAVEGLPVPFFVLAPCDGETTRFRVVWANDAAHDFTGHGRATPWPEIDRLLGHLPELEDEVWRARHGRNVTSKVWPVDRQGRIDHLRLVLVPLDGGVALFVQDVSREAGVRADLEVAEHTLERVQQWGQMGVWEVDLCTGEQYWSSQVYTILDVDEASVETFRGAVHPEDLELVRHVLRRAVDQPGPYKFNHRVIRRDDVRSVSQHLQSVPGADGRPERLIGAIVDMTATEAIEQRLHQSQRVRSIGLLAGGLAHDFNNALAILLGHIDTVEHHDAVADHPDLAMSVDAMKRATKRASALTRKLMSLGQPGEPQREVLPVAEVLENTARLVAPALGSAVQVNVEVDVDPAAEVPTAASVTVAADPTHVEQVLLDLVLNARDAGATTIDLWADRASVGAGGELALAWGLTPGAYGVLSVADDGSGMDHETVRHIFDPFFTTKSADDGSGLGLTNADRFARRAGGALIPTSRVGQGTTMSLYLPLVDRELGHGGTGRATTTRTGPKPTRAVVSVSSPERSTRLAEMLAARRHQVAVAETTAETSWIVATEPIDLVVIDAQLLDLGAERTLDPDRTIILGGTGTGSLANAPHLEDPDDTTAVAELVDELLPPVA